jgi:hypothetical protein
LIIEDVEAWEFVQWDAVIKNWVRLSSKDIHTVSKVGKGLREMARVHALSANMWLASVCEVRNAQWAIGVVRA